MAVSVKPSSIQNAINKAVATEAYRTVEQATATEWFVRGTNDWYVVFRQSDGSLGCTCEGGRRGLPACFHRAAQWLAQARDNMMVSGTSRAN